MNSLRTGVIGCGRHARTNIYPSLTLLGVQPVSVCARHIEHARATAREFGQGTAYDDYRQMLARENLDAVIVVLPETIQAEVVCACLEAGVHVFVEKPLGLNQAAAAQVAEVSARTGKHAMVGFMKRYAPVYVELKRVTQDQEHFGEILALTGMYAIGPFRSQEFFLQNVAIHYIDLLRFLLGEMRDVTGYSNSHGENTDVAFAFATANGCIGTMHFAGLPAWARHTEEVTVTGLKSFARAQDLRKLTEHRVNPAGEAGAPRWQLLDEEERVVTAIYTDASGGWKDLYVNGFVGELRHFLECIAAGQAPSPSAEDNVKTMALCDRLLKEIRRVE